MIYSASINEDGTLGEWIISGNLPDRIVDSQVVVIKDRVYLLGGWVNNSSSSKVYTCTINGDGTLGEWTTYNNLPVTVCKSQAVIVKNRIYVLGGLINSLVSSIVYTCVINKDGSLSEWVERIRLPDKVVDSQVVVIKDRIYLLGGRISDSFKSTVYTSVIT